MDALSSSDSDGRWLRDCLTGEGVLIFGVRPARDGVDFGVDFGVVTGE